MWGGWNYRGGKRGQRNSKFSKVFAFASAEGLPDLGSLMLLLNNHLLRAEGRPPSAAAVVCSPQPASYGSPPVPNRISHDQRLRGKGKAVQVGWGEGHLGLASSHKVGRERNSLPDWIRPLVNTGRSSCSPDDPVWETMEKKICGPFSKHSLVFQVF